MTSSRISLPAEPASVATARRFVAERIGDADRAATAVLLVSELATNVVRHVGSELTIEVTDGDPVRVEVHDGGPPLPAPAPMQPNVTSGRGLHIVAAFATAWGSEVTADGKVVWFEL